MLNKRLLSKQALFFLLVLCLGLWMYCIRITGYTLEFVPGDLGDSRFINYLLEHGYQYLCGTTHSFWSPDIMYPTKNVLAFSDNMLGGLPVYATFRFLSFDIQTAYQLWWMCICILNFVCCYIVLVRWTNNAYLAACGAFIFAFGIFNQSQMSYLQMNCRFMVPFVFWYVYRIVSLNQPLAWIGFMISLVIQFYLSIYLGFLLFYVSVIFILIAAFIYKTTFLKALYHNRTHFYAILITGILSIVALLFLLWPYYKMSAITGLRYYHDVTPSLPTIGSYFFAHQASGTWHFLSEWYKQQNAWWLQNIMPGIIPLIAFLTGCIYLLWALFTKHKITPLVKLVVICSLLVFVLFLRTENGHSLYALIFKLPGMNSLRVLTRILHVQLFLWVLLFILLLQQFIPKKQSPFILLFLLALLFIDNWFDADKTVRTSKKEIQHRHATAKNEILAKHDKQPVFAFTSNKTAHEVHLDAMFCSLDLHMPTINGYSSYCETAFGQFFNTCSKEGLDYWLNKNHISANKVLIIER